MVLITLLKDALGVLPSRSGLCVRTAGAARRRRPRRGGGTRPCTRPAAARARTYHHPSGIPRSHSALISEVHLMGHFSNDVHLYQKCISSSRRAPLPASRAGARGAGLSPAGACGRGARGSRARTPATACTCHRYRISNTSRMMCTYIRSVFNGTLLE